LRRHGLNDFSFVERVADADLPVFAIGVLAAGLDVAAGIDKKVPRAGTADKTRGVADGPALDD
jgi:hypothetical protein